SSPKPSRETPVPRQDSNLRRAVSCGVAGTKRRKVEKSKLGSQGSSQQRELEAASKSSLVTALLDTVNGNCQSPAQEHQTPAASPSPRRRPRPAVESPCRAAGAPDPASSDYGDDDFDDDTFIELEAVMKSTQAAASTAAPAMDTLVAPKGPVEAPADQFDDSDDGIFDDGPPPLARRGLTTPRSARTRPPASPGDDFEDDF